MQMQDYVLYDWCAEVWEFRKKRVDGMSMIRKQVSTLRKLAEMQDTTYEKRIINRAADTIESLSAKLQCKNFVVENCISIKSVIKDFEEKLEGTKLQIKLVNDYENKDSMGVFEEIVIFSERIRCYEEFLKTLKSYSQVENSELPAERILIDKNKLIEDFRKCYSGNLGMENSDSLIMFKSVCRIINQQPYAQYNCGWTYCGDGENLPEEPFGCIVTVILEESMTGQDRNVILPYHVGYDGKQWNDLDGQKIPFDVIAWIPAPKEAYFEN